MKNIAIFASGTKDGGGSGAKILLEKMASREIPGVDNVTIVSNHPEGGPYQIVEDFKEKFERLHIGLNFHHIDNFPKREDNREFSEESITILRKMGGDIMRQYDLHYIFLSGWIKHILGLPVDKVVNIHPGPIREPYGGVGMYGDNIHKKIWEDYQAGIIQRSCITLHFVTDEVDAGPIICQIPVDISMCTSPEDVAKQVNSTEHGHQWKITKMVVDGDVYLDDNGIVQYPSNFPYQEKVSLI